MTVMRLRLGELLDARGLTAYALADESDGRLSRSAAYRLLRGQTKSVGFEELAALCDVLGVSVDELFEVTARKARRG